MAERAAAKAAAEREMREAAAHAAAMRALHKLQVALRAGGQEALSAALRQAEPLVGALPALATEIAMAKSRLGHSSISLASRSASDDGVVKEDTLPMATLSSPRLEVRRSAMTDHQASSSSSKLIAKTFCLGAR